MKANILIFIISQMAFSYNPHQCNEGMSFLSTRPILSRFIEAADVLEKISLDLLPHDKEFLESISRFLKKDPQKENDSILVMNILRSYLQDLGSPGIFYYRIAILKNLSCLNDIYNIKDLNDLKGYSFFELKGLEIFYQSILTSKTLHTAKQEAVSQKLLNILQKAIEANDKKIFLNQLEEFKKYLLEIKENPLLKSRAVLGEVFISFLNTEAFL